jgi:hypothetical protein
VNSLVKLTLTLMLVGLLAACAGAPLNPPADQADGHIVQGGSFAGEGKIYFPFPFEDGKE